MSTATSPACRKCGSQKRSESEQRFRDGTTHRRLACGGCGAFVQYLPRRSQPEQQHQRQPLRLAPETTPAASSTPRTSTTGTSAGLPAAPSMSDRAADTLATVEERANQLRRQLEEHPPTDPAQALAIYSVSQAAAAALADENLDSLHRAIRTGRLPRKGITR